MEWLRIVRSIIEKGRQRASLESLLDMSKEVEDSALNNTLLSMDDEIDDLVYDLIEHENDFNLYLKKHEEIFGKLKTEPKRDHLEDSTDLPGL